ncbi:hypothetical protein EB061_11460, partial [bacterium]|nr:hypothetical protein [bacterium]
LETPIREELEVIGQHLSRLGKVRVLIDDLRCFDPHSEIFRDYPSLDYLVEWSQKHGLHWSIEQDIFIAKR